MKNLISIGIFFSLSIFSSVGAQTVIKSDTLSGVPLVISMDKDISDLLAKEEDNCERINDNKTFVNENNGGSSGASKNKVNVPDKEMTNAEICRKNPRIMGYKIQLTVVKSNEEAREVGLYFRRRFPSMKVEIDASLRPNYKVMAGSYFTKESAASDLKRIKEYFKSAIPIQYRIFCVEAK